MKRGYRILIFFLIFFLVLSGFIFVAQKVRGATNIAADAPPEYRHWAWNDVIGWVDLYSTNNVNVYPGRLEGYASSSVGFIALNCNSTPNGNICNPPTLDFKVSNDGSGNLSGWAWSDAIGWISFDCHNPETGGSSPDYSCLQSNYRVIINSGGQFSGWAWNDVIGWISFNCSNTGTCVPVPPGVNYKTQLAWDLTLAGGFLESSIFDTGVISGAAFNYILWRGSLNGGSVSFQLAASNCANGATDPPEEGAIDPPGPSHCITNPGWGGSKVDVDGAFSASLPSTGADIPAKISNINNKRYFRYKIFISTDTWRTASPVVTDVIVNWSP